MVSRITDCLWSNTTWRANSTVYISEGTHKASGLRPVLLCLGKPREDLTEQLLLFLATISFGCYVCTAEYKRPKVGPRREQQTLTIQFLTLLMSNSRFPPLFLNPRFLTFPRTLPRCGYACWCQYQECTLGANMVGPRKNYASFPHLATSSTLFFFLWGSVPSKRIFQVWGSW